MRRGDLFVLSWESLRRVEWGKVSSLKKKMDWSSSTLPFYRLGARPFQSG